MKLRRPSFASLPKGDHVSDVSGHLVGSGHSLGCLDSSDPERFRRLRTAVGLVVFLALALLPSGLVSACEIKFGVDDASQGPYAAGTTVIFRLRVDLTHNNCPVEMKETKIQGIGLNILGATPWQSPSPNVWERRIKVTIAPNPGGQATLTAKRSCDKDGGWGTFSIEAKPIKL
jgi:hypothetical protein